MSQDPHKPAPSPLARDRQASVVQPHISVLTPEQIAEVHERSTHLLATVGVRVSSPAARQLLARATGRQADDDGRVRIPRDLVEWAMHAAPSCVDVYDHHGSLAFRLGDGATRLGDSATRFGVGVACLYYQDPETDQVVPFTRQHAHDGPPGQRAALL